MNSSGGSSEAPRIGALSSLRWLLLRRRFNNAWTSKAVAGTANDTRRAIGATHTKSSASGTIGTLAAHFSLSDRCLSMSRNGRDAAKNAMAYTGGRSARTAPVSTLVVPAVDKIPNAVVGSQAATASNLNG